MFTALQQRCWACSTIVPVEPYQLQLPCAVFKVRCKAFGLPPRPPPARHCTALGPGPHLSMQCSWCGAFNIPLSARQLEDQRGSAAAAFRACAPRLALTAPRPRPRPRATVIAGRLLLGCVVLLIATLVAIGACLVLPAAFGPTSLLLLHYPLLALLLAGMAGNLAACICRPSGPVAAALAARIAAPGVSTSSLPRGCLDGCAYCERCGYYKPACAHHCRWGAGPGGGGGRDAAAGGRALGAGCSCN